jgi:hypothetical protein
MPIREGPVLAQPVERGERPHQPVVTRRGQAFAETHERSRRTRQAPRVAVTNGARRGGASGAPRKGCQARRAGRVGKRRQGIHQTVPRRPRVLGAGRDAQVGHGDASPLHLEPARHEAVLAGEDRQAGLELPGRHVMRVRPRRECHRERRRQGRGTVQGEEPAAGLEPLHIDRARERRMNAPAAVGGPEALRESPAESASSRVTGAKGVRRVIAGRG